MPRNVGVMNSETTAAIAATASDAAPASPLRGLSTVNLYADDVAAARRWYAEFLGAGPTGDVYLLFLSAGLLTNPTALPNVIGPVHLDPASAVFVGLYVPLGATTPYHTITLPLNPALQNVDFFDQALALHAGGALETTRVDCFRF